MRWVRIREQTSLGNTGLDDSEFEYLQEQRIFLISETSRSALEPTQLPINWKQGTLLSAIQ